MDNVKKRKITAPDPTPAPAPEKALSKTDYQESLTGAELALKYSVDPAEKKNLKEYIDGLKIIIKYL